MKQLRGHRDSTSGDFTDILEGVTAVSPAARNCTTYLDVLSRTKNFMSPESHSPIRRRWPSSKKQHPIRLRDSGFRIYGKKKDMGKQKLEGEMIGGLKTSN